MATSRQIFDLTILNHRHRDMRALRRTHGLPSHHGNKLWRSSVLLMDYLQEFPISQGARVLEVGCGWGLAGIYSAKVFDAQVTCSDLDASVLPFADHHAFINQVTITTLQKGYQKFTGADLAHFDVLMGGDICFWDEQASLVYNLVRRAQKNGVRTIIADPGRTPYAEMALRACDKLGAMCDPWFVPHPHNARGYILDVPAV
ncbi:class I SAM-dependent methyltransferase [Marinagarivorans algicola]|uniref:class I SAM-dependent methyltransferase n=1 Tax=Marinagarivorans algicola TaxID=1513270 RepID=UPI0006B4ECFA|nr:methyltransferase domain-containing protein [Marinagarivorans algicola]